MVCGTVTLNGSVSLSNNATLALDSANNTQTICAGNTITPIQYTFGGGATGATVTGLPTGVTATTTGNTITITGTPTSAFFLYYFNNRWLWNGNVKQEVFH